MPLSCVAYGCTNHNRMDNKPGFFRFPNNDPALREKWINACKRINKDGTSWNPKGKNVYLCGKHFISGRAIRDSQHPDYVPSIFAFIQSDPEKDKKEFSRLNSAKRKGETSSSHLPEKGIPSQVEVSNEMMMKSDEERLPHEPTEGSVFAFIQSDPEKDKKEFSRLNSAKRKGETSSSHLPEKGIPSQVEGSDEIMMKSDEERLLHEPTEGSSSTQDNVEVLLESAQKKTDYFKMEEQYLSEIENLQKARDELLEQLVKIHTFGYELLKTKPKRFVYYAGISPDKFSVVLNYLKKFWKEKSKEKLSVEDQVLMTLMKLRLNLQLEILSDMFHTPKTTLNSMFWKVIDLMFSKMAFLVRWPDHEASMKTLPPVFKQYFPRLTGIIDCIEILIDRPKNLKARAQVYSNNKKHSTAKFLIACTPLGAISFLSKAWGGRVSDVELVKNSGLINKDMHHFGDQILADRGFTLVDEFAAGCGVELKVPSFTKRRKQLTAKEVETTRQIASVRIHIERVIGVLKCRYSILQGPLPIKTIKSLTDEANGAEYCRLDKIITVCAILVNLGDSIFY